MIRRFILAILIIVPSALLAQQGNIGKLKGELQTAKDGEKVKILNQLAALHLDRSADMTHYYADEALREVTELENRFINKIDSEHIHLKDLMRFKAEAFINKGLAYGQQGNDKKALRYFKEAKSKAEKANQSALAMQAKEHLKSYEEKGRWEKFTIGVIDEVDDLKELLEDANIPEEIGNAAISGVESIAENALQKKDFFNAIRYYKILLPHYKEDTDKLIETHETLSALFEEVNDSRQAAEHQARADEFAGRVPPPAVPSPKPAAAATPQPPSPKEAVEDFIAVVEATEKSAPVIAKTDEVAKDGEIFRRKAEEAAEKGNLKVANENYKEYAERLKELMELKMQRMQDSLLISSNFQELDQLRLQQELQETEAKRSKSTRNWLFFTLALVLLIAGLLTSLFFNKRKAHRKTKQAFDQLADTHLQLKSAQTQLVSAEKMASLGQLTAGIAHEINNPVNFITGNITPLKHDVQDLLTLLNAYEQAIDEERLGDRFEAVKQLREKLEIDYVTEEIEELLEGINEGASRTTEIVKGLRTFARLDDGDWKRFDLHHGLDSTLALLKNRLINIEVLKDYGDLPEIEGYPGKLNQVFMNLLTNAIQAMPDGGLIHLITFPFPDDIEIRVRDTGMGIPKEVRNRIFDPFFTTKGIGEGTGLGLSISHGIVKQHGGSIKLESIEGQGTEVIIRIPRTQTT